MEHALLIRDFGRNKDVHVPPQFAVVCTKWNTLFSFGILGAIKLCRFRHSLWLFAQNGTRSSPSGFMTEV
jgi:hypothetical protein